MPGNNDHGNHDHFPNTIHEEQQLQHKDRLKKLKEQSITTNKNMNAVEYLQSEVQNIKKIENSIANLETKIDKKQ